MPTTFSDVVCVTLRCHTHTQVKSKQDGGSDRGHDGVSEARLQVRLSLRPVYSLLSTQFHTLVCIWLSASILCIIRIMSKRKGTGRYVKARLCRAKTYETLGKVKEAYDDYKRAMSYEPTNTQARRYLYACLHVLCLCAHTLFVPPAHKFQFQWLHTRHVP
jgi:hypothetical protein